MIELRLDLPPTTNKSFKVGRGRFYETPEYRNYKVVAGMTARSQCKHRPTDKDLKLEIDMYQRFGGDIDGRLKPLLDSLNGVIYIDDKQVVEIVVRKHTSKRAYCTVSYLLAQSELF